MSSEEDGEDVDQVTGISGKNAAVINQINKHNSFVKETMSAVRSTFRDKVAAANTPSKIVDGRLQLLHYHISDLTSIILYQQLCQQVTAPAYQRLIDLQLWQNGLKDNTSAFLFKCLHSAKHLKRLSYKQNELGPQTAFEIGRMLLWPSPHHLQHLILQDVKTQVSSIGTLLYFMKDNRGLKTLRLKGIDLNNARLITLLIRFFRQNTQNLTNLQLSSTNLPLASLSQIVGYLTRNRTALQWLDISGHKLAKTKASLILASKLKYILQNCSLVHLDLSGMLLDKLVFIVLEGIFESKTLQAVHLSDNEFTVDQCFIIDKILRIPLSQVTDLEQRYFTP